MLSLLSLSRGTESSGCRRIARATRSGRRLTRPCGRCLIDLFRICIRQAVHFIFSLLKKFRPGNGRRYAPRAAGAAPRLRLSPPLLFDSAVQRSTVIRAVLPSPWGPTKNQRARDVVVQRDTAPLSSTRASSAALLQAEASSRHGDGQKQRCISHKVTLPLLAAVRWRVPHRQTGHSRWLHRQQRRQRAREKERLTVRSRPTHPLSPCGSRPTRAESFLSATRASAYCP